MTELACRDRRGARRVGASPIGDPPDYVVVHEAPTEADVFISLDGRPVAFDLPAAIRLGVRCGCPDVSPLETLVRTATGRWVLLTDPPGRGMEDEPIPPAREMTPEAAAGWIARNEHMIPDALKGVTPSDEPKPQPGTPAPRTIPEMEQELIDALKKSGKPVRAALAEFMVGRLSADAQDVAKYVHDDPGPWDDFGTVNRNCLRVTEEAEALGIPISYKVAGGKVWKEDAGSR
jgi:hypothetical protein